MNDVKWERYGALAGGVFVVLVLVSGFIAGAPPNPDDSAREIRDYFVDHDTALKAAGYLGGLSVVPFLVFLASLWSRVRGAGDESRRLATIVAGGGVIAAGLATVGTSITTSTAIRINEVGPGGAKFFFLLAGNLTSMIAFAAAAIVGATSLAALRARVFPTWLGWAGAALTLVWFVAGLSVTTDSARVGLLGFIAFLLWGVWILLICFFLYRPHTGTRRTNAVISGPGG
jgi:hypothetical protein